MKEPRKNKMKPDLNRLIVNMKKDINELSGKHYGELSLTERILLKDLTFLVKALEGNHDEKLPV